MTTTDAICKLRSRSTLKHNQITVELRHNIKQVCDLSQILVECLQQPNFNTRLDFFALQICGRKVQAVKVVWLFFYLRLWYVAFKRFAKVTKLLLRSFLFITRRPIALESQSIASFWVLSLKKKQANWHWFCVKVPITSKGPPRDVTLPQRISKPNVLSFFNISTRKSASYDVFIDSLARSAGELWTNFAWKPLKWI